MNQRGMNRVFRRTRADDDYRDNAQVYNAVNDRLEQTQKELPMPTPTPNSPAVTPQTRAEALAAPFQPVAVRFQSAIADLQKRPLSRATVELAKEYDVDANKYLKDIEASELRKQADSAFSMHRYLTGIIAKLTSPADSLRRQCSSIFTNFDRQERQRLAEEQRDRDAALRAQQEAERVAELEAMKAAEVPAEIIEQRAAEPIPEVVAPPAKEETKVAGVSVVYSAGFGEIIDRAAFAKWLSEHPDDLGGFEPKPAYWKAKLSAHLNKQTGAMSIEIPGLKVLITSSSRHRGREE